MITKDIVRRILFSRKNLSRKVVLRMIEKKKEDADGFLTDEAAAYIVASELGVEISLEPFSPEVSIRDLVPGLNDVALRGRVIVVYPTKTFAYPNKVEGKVTRLLIADKSGMLKVVIWNDKTRLVETGRIKEGQLLGVAHGYVREGLDGNIELHVGSRGEVQICPTDIEDSEYPYITFFMEKIERITQKHKRVNILGIVQSVTSRSEFKRVDGTLGKVMRLRVVDDTGQITVVFWNEGLTKLEDVKKGSFLQVMDARVKERSDGRFELHVKDAVQTKILNEKPPHFETKSIFPFQRVKIKDLKPSMYYVNVFAKVVHIEDQKEFRRSDGKVGRLCRLLIKDETGSIQSNLWDDKVELCKQIQLGDILLFEGAYTRKRSGKTQLNVGKYGSLTLNPSSVDEEKSNL